MSLRPYVVTWTRRFSDGQDHEIRDVILSTSRKRAASVVQQLYGRWPGFALRRVQTAREAAKKAQPPRAT